MKLKRQRRENKLFPALDVLFNEEIEMEEILYGKNLDHLRMEVFNGYDAPESLSPADLWEYGYRYDPKLKHFSVMPEAHHANRYFYLMAGNTADVINPPKTKPIKMIQEIKLTRYERKPYRTEDK